MASASPDKFDYDVEIPNFSKSSTALKDAKDAKKYFDHRLEKVNLSHPRGGIFQKRSLEYNTKKLANAEQAVKTTIHAFMTIFKEDKDKLKIYNTALAELKKDENEQKQKLMRLEEIVKVQFSKLNKIIVEKQNTTGDKTDLQQQYVNQTQLITKITNNMKKLGEYIEKLQQKRQDLQLTEQDKTLLQLDLEKLLLFEAQSLMGKDAVDAVAAVAALSTQIREHGMPTQKQMEAELNNSLAGGSRQKSKTHNKKSKTHNKSKASKINKSKKTRKNRKH